MSCLLRLLKLKQNGDIYPQRSQSQRPESESEEQEWALKKKTTGQHLHQETANGSSVMISIRVLGGHSFRVLELGTLEDIYLGIGILGPVKGHRALRGLALS